MKEKPLRGDTEVLKERFFLGFLILFTETWTMGGAGSCQVGRFLVVCRFFSDCFLSMCPFFLRP